MTDSAGRARHAPLPNMHPSDSSIELWLNDQLPASQLATFETHLETCPTCEARVEQIIRDQGEGTLVQIIARGLRHTIDLRRDAVAQETSIEGTPASTPTSSRDSFAWTTQFRRLGIHASGGQGVIWRAFETPIGREVAIKELRPEHLGSSSIEARLIREARLTGRLSHPGIVAVHRLEVSGYSVFYTMPLLHGQPLSKTIQSFHQRPEDHSTSRLSDFHKLIDAFLSVCQTIEFAHARNVIHRDIKSDNVMVGEYGEITVLDWGLAKDLSDDINHPDLEDAEVSTITNAVGETQLGQKLGTPAYMAPEQVRGDSAAVGKRSDVYGLTALLYEILTGSPPFRADSVAETFQKILNEELLPPNQINSMVPDELNSICLEGLAKRPQDRIESAAALGERVRRWKVTQIERRRSDAERQRFFDFSADMMAILDDSHTIRAANRAWEATLGWSAEHVVGRAQLEFLHPDDREMVQNFIAEVHRGKTIQHAEVRLKHRDGGYRWTLWNATPIANEKQIYVIGRDITDRKRHERLLEHILDAAPVAMVVVDANARVVGVNARLRAWIGIEDVPYAGCDVSSFLCADDRQQPIGPTDLIEWAQWQHEGKEIPELQLISPEGQIRCPHTDISLVDFEDTRYVTIAIRLPPKTTQTTPAD